jgi:hypothetical protein
MAQEFKPGQIVPQSGVYKITHDPLHADMPHEVTVIKGRRFPTCRHCKGITFELAHAAKHVSEIDHLEEVACAGGITCSRRRHGAADSAFFARGGSAGMDSAPAHQARRLGAGRRSVAARDQIRRLPHARAPRPRCGAAPHPHRARLDP